MWCLRLISILWVMTGVTIPVWLTVCLERIGCHSIMKKVSRNFNGIHEALAIAELINSNFSYLHCWLLLYLRSVHTPRYLPCDAVRYHIQVKMLT